jgi:hypothetical protein
MGKKKLKSLSVSGSVLALRDIWNSHIVFGLESMALRITELLYWE